MGVSQSDLAVSSGFTLAQYGSWERGQTEPKITDLARIADRLGLSVHWLVTGHGPKESIVVEGAAPVYPADAAEIARALASAHPSSILRSAAELSEEREIAAMTVARAIAAYKEVTGKDLTALGEEAIKRLGVCPDQTMDAAQWEITRILDPEVLGEHKPAAKRKTRSVKKKKKKSG